MIHDSDGTPVQSLDIVARYPSKAAAARAMKVSPSAIFDAVENGKKCRGLWWRYSDISSQHQPKLRAGREKAIVDANGARHNSVMSAVKAYFIDAVPTQRDIHTEWMRLKRAIVTGREWMGQKYRYET